METPQFKLGPIGVVMLGVRDVGRAVAFYRDNLGLKVTGEIETFVFLDGGSVTLCLSHLLARASQQLVGATEVVFSVGDVKAAYDWLRGRGVQFTHEPRIVSGSNWAANFADPDGHRLSIFGPNPSA